MKNKKNVSFLFGTVGVIVMLAIVAAVCLLSNVYKVRMDLTADRLFTLSQGTKDILARLDTPVELRVYCSQGGSEAAQLFVKNYSRNVDDLLKEYSKAAKGMLRVKRYNPEPDSDAEDMAHADGVEGQTINTGDVIYMGIAISCLDNTVALPFLSPTRERLLEYDISRAIARVASPDKVKVGVVTDLPVFGMEMNPMMMQMQQRGMPAWTFISELKSDFEVVELGTNLEEIPEDIQTLIVIHPKNLSDSTLFALDQFILRGGRMLAYVDPLFRLDPAGQSQQNPMAQYETASTMEKLFTAWGITFDTTRVLADKNYPTTLGSQTGQAEFITVLSLTADAFSEENVATSQVDSALMAFAGTFSGTPADGLTKTTLIKSSTNSQLVDKMLSERNQILNRDFQASNKQHDLAVMLTGKFKTAFPDGKPAKADAKDEDEDEEKTEEKAPEAEKPALKDATKEGAVVLVGDVDMLHDNFSVRVTSIFGQRIVQPLNGNLTLAQNITEQLAGNSSLINMRSRATMNRPFTKIQEYRAKAEQQYQSQLMDLENRLNEARTKISELQRAKTDGSQKFILSDEQKAELANFRKSEAETAKKLKEVRKNLRKDITSLENNLTWINTAGMAFVVVLVGIVIAIIKRKRTAAK